MHSFTTERLLIRPLAVQDKALFINLYTDAKVMRNISEPLTDEKAEKAFHNTLKIMEKDHPKILTWAIVNLADNQSIGIQGFTWPTNKSESSTESKMIIAEIGIMLLRNSHGRLFTEEAMGALMEYGFNYLGLDKINAFYASKNLATKRFVNKLGFIYNEALQGNVNKSNTVNSYQYAESDQWQQKLICQVREYI
jgi:RimJ/RimL family protein N-acetyltransferase